MERVDDDFSHHLYSRLVQKVERSVDGIPVMPVLKLRYLKGMSLPRAVP